MVLACAMIMMCYFDPYVAPVDQHVALVSLLSLSGVAHISSIFKAGTTWDPLYVVLTALLFFLPLAAYGAEHTYQHRHRGDKAKAQALVRKAEAVAQKAMLTMLSYVETAAVYKTVQKHGAKLRMCATSFRYC